MWWNKVIKLPLENYVVKFVTIIQLEGLYGNIELACFTSGQFIFGKKITITALENNIIEHTMCLWQWRWYQKMKF